MPRRLRAGAAAVALALCAVPAGAQLPGTQFSLGTGGAAVVTLDQDRLFAESAFGQAVAAAVERSATALTEENRTLEQTLASEERDLTERRATLEPAEFRALAEAFDDRVQTIRRRQEARGRAIGAFRDAQRQRFFEAAVPVVTEVVLASGAVAVLDSRAIVLALDEVDITDRVLARLDAVLGADGVPGRVPQDAPDTAPQPGTQTGSQSGLRTGPQPRPRPGMPAPQGGEAPGTAPIGLPSPAVPDRTQPPPTTPAPPPPE